MPPSLDFVEDLSFVSLVGRDSNKGRHDSRAVGELNLLVGADLMACFEGVS